MTASLSREEIAKREIGKTDIAHKIQTACTAMVQLRNDKWVRVYPSKPGTFDCTPSNHVEFKADLVNG